MKNRITLLNMISGLLLQLITILAGFILPKIILVYFGSEANGLVNSLNQFLNYISLVEGGISSVIYANLYKPLVNNDESKVSSIIVTANWFFKKIGIIFVIYSVFLALILPIFLKSDFSYLSICSLTLIMSTGMLIQYMFSLSLKSLLIADKKGYIVNFTQCLIIVFNISLSLISVYIYPNIHLLKAISCSLYIIQPLVFNKFIKKNYNIDWNAKKDNSLISERWDGFAINIAAFIHECTDITILTIFTNLKVVSIYSVYSLVATGIQKLITASLSGVAQTIGQAYAKEEYGEVNEKMDIFEYIVFGLTYFFGTASTLLITPFVLLYTKGITDTNYNQPLFGVLLVISTIFYLIKLPHLNLAYSTNKFKEITIPAYMEAGINIMVSIILVKKFGLIGVTIGTICAMVYRMIFHVYYTAKILPGRNQNIFYKKLFSYATCSLISYLLCSYIYPFTDITINEWINHAIVYCIIIGILLTLLSISFYKKEIKFLINYIKNK